MASDDFIFPAHIDRIRFHGRTFERIIRIGIPSGFQSSMYAISNVLIQSAINSFGTDVMAAYTAYAKIEAINWMAIWHQVELLYICFPISWFITGCMFLIYYYRGKRSFD